MFQTFEQDCKSKRDTLNIGRDFEMVDRALGMIFFFSCGEETNRPIEREFSDREACATYVDASYQASTLLAKLV